jgi:hypothetical protein
MIKRNDLDVLLEQSRNTEAQRQAARLEAFQEMVRVLQNQQIESPGQLKESKTPYYVKGNDSKIKSC